MSHNALPDAAAHFLVGLSTGDASAVRRGLALSVVAVAADERFRGTDAVVALVDSHPTFSRVAEWSVAYAMDSEVVVVSDAGDEVQLVLDCGRIALVRVTAAVAASADAVAA